MSDIVTAEEAAKSLKISRTTFQRLVKDGRVKPISEKNPILKRQSKLLFNRSDIERLLNP